MAISQLPQQTRAGGPSFPVGADVNSLDSGLTIANGGNVTVKREGWAATLMRELSNRYIASAYCNWWVDKRLNFDVCINGLRGLGLRLEVLFLTL